MATFVVPPYRVLFLPYYGPHDCLFRPLPARYHICGDISRSMGPVIGVAVVRGAIGPRNVIHSPPLKTCALSDTPERHYHRRSGYTDDR
jgi:hypothetical protein